MTKPNNQNSPTNRWLRRLIGFCLYSVLLFALVLALDLYRNRLVPESLPVQQLLMDIQGKGHNVQSLSYEGPVLVYFWATWCPVCQLTSPVIDGFNDNYPVVSIALRSGDNKKLHHYMTAKDYHFPVINDQDGLLTEQWQVGVTPTIALVVNGQIVWVTSGVTTSLGLKARIWFYKHFN
ncbi:protein disulfide oxidoreductase [Alkalimonas sp. NCh-2]|uniref:protein disulfide oxidoreductase n=1 Tax=Alkalimonas sp. NCh-2 TaxID=3144846 RepID=UPI0031F6F14D